MVPGAPCGRRARAQRGRQARFKRARGRTSLGAEKWLDTPLHQGTPAAVAALRAAGYRVAAAQACPPGSAMGGAPFLSTLASRGGRIGLPLYAANMRRCELCIRRSVMG
jgi:hypothetical protein